MSKLKIQINNSLKLTIFSLILLTATFLLNINTLSNKFAFDDKGLIQDNKLIIEGTNVKEIFTTNYRSGANNPEDGLYRPLVMLTFVLNTNNKTFNPQPLHFFNELLNAINSSLFFLLIYFFFGNYIIAYFSAMIFSFHPIHTEVVANISGRPELMCAFFIFLSWILLEKINKPIISYLTGSFILFLALISKETAVMFPVMVIATDFALKRNIKDKYTISKFLLLIITVIIYIIIRWYILGSTATGNEPEFFNNPIAYSPIMERVATALGVFLRYCSLLFFPLKLLSDYSYNTLPIYDSLWNPFPIIALCLGIIFFSCVVIRSFLYISSMLNTCFAACCVRFFIFSATPFSEK